MQRTQSTADEDSEIPVVSIDYFYYGEKDGESTNLQVKDSKSKMTWATTIPTKGPDLFSVNFMLACLNETGYNRLILKSDGEPAMIDHGYYS